MINEIKRILLKDKDFLPVISFAVFAGFIFLSLLFLLSGCGGGSGAGSAYQPPVYGSPTTINLWTNRQNVETGATVVVVAQLIDSSGRGVSGKSVQFTATGGSMTSSSATTDSKGIASTNITSTVKGNVDVTANADGYKAARTIYFTDNLSYRPTMTVMVDGNWNGTYDEPDDYIIFQTASDNTAVIKVNLQEITEQPAKGITVNLASQNGIANVSFTSGSSALTDTSGNAYFVVTFTSGIITGGKTYVSILVNATVESESLMKVLTFTVSPVSVSGILLSALPSEVKITETSAVSAKVYLTSGSLAPDGTMVNFTSMSLSSMSCGTVEPYATTTAGTATTTFTAPSSMPDGGKCEVTAEISGVSKNIDITILSDLIVLPPTIVIKGADGGVATYTVSYGKPPYTVSSDKAAYQPDNYTLAKSGDKFSTTVKPGSKAEDITFTIKDAKGTTVTAKLSITDGGTFTVVPETVTVKGYGTTVGTPDGDGRDDIGFYIQGGTAPYTVTSSMPGIIASPGVLTGKTFTVDPISATASVSLIVTDAVGNLKTVTVNVTP